MRWKAYCHMARLAIHPDHAAQAAAHTRKPPVLTGSVAVAQLKADQAKAQAYTRAFDVALCVSTSESCPAARRV